MFSINQAFQDAKQIFAITRIAATWKVILQDPSRQKGDDNEIPSMTLSILWAAFLSLFKLQDSSSTSGIGYKTGAGGTGTEVTNAVTVSKVCGTITTSSLSNAAAGEYDIVVTNTTVEATDVPVVAIKAYAGAGKPFATVVAVAADQFTIRITNLHATDALNAVATINFAIVRGVAA